VVVFTSLARRQLALAHPLGRLHHPSTPSFLSTKHWDLNFKLFLALESNRPTADTSFVDVFCKCQCRDVITDLSLLHLHTVVKEQTLAIQFSSAERQQTDISSILLAPSPFLPPLSSHHITILPSGHILPSDQEHWLTKHLNRRNLYTTPLRRKRRGE
jgi:hypothetical protein